jgi:phosphoglycerate dehydrogenase-like enzyme
VWGPAGTVAACREADVVVTALPDSPDTRGIVDRRALEAIGEGWFVNVGRGTVVDEEALADLLRSRRMRGAALDVFAIEPLPPESPLGDLPNVVLTTHTAWSSDRFPGRLAGLFARNLAAFRGEGEWATRVA